MHQQRAGIRSLQHLLEQLIGHRVQALEEVAQLEWQHELAVEEQEHEVGDVNVRQPLAIAQALVGPSLMDHQYRQQPSCRLKKANCRQASHQDVGGGRRGKRNGSRRTIGRCV